MTDPTIVSLLPGATEMLYAVGAEPAGVSHSCDYPPAARGKPTLTSTTIDPDADAGAIDEQVQDADGAVYDVDRETLRELDPDLVVTQATCDVCAVDASEVFAAVEGLDLDADVLTLDPHSLEDVFEDVRRIGEATGRAEAAGEVVADLRRRANRVADRAPGDVSRVTVLDWTDPVMVAGHWVHGMVERAGGSYGPTEPGAPSVPVEWDEVRAFDPNVLVVTPCGFDLDRAVESVADLAANDGWADLTAVRENRVYAVDGSGYANRPGPRLVDALEALAACLSPDRFGDPDPTVARRIELSGVVP